MPPCGPALLLSDARRAVTIDSTSDEILTRGRIDSVCPTEWTNFDGFSPAFFPTLPSLIEKEIDNRRNVERSG